MPGPIVEPENCDSVIGEVDSSICKPKVRSGQVQRAFITLLDGNEDFTPFVTASDGGVISTSVNNPAAWTSRMDQTGEATGAIITLHGIGEKPLAEDEEQELPLGQTRVLDRVHTLPFTVFETSDKINMLMRKWAAFGATVGLWYETSQPTLLGNGTAIHKPIRASVKPGQVIPRERAGVHVWEVSFTWKDLKPEDMIDSPVPDTPEPATASASGSGA